VTAPQVSPASPASTVFRTVAQFLSRYRVPISLVVFTALIAEDVLEGLRPHDLLNYNDVHSISGIVLIIAGVLLRTWAAGTIHKGTGLTTTGPYGIIRNPLYVGSFLMMIGFCALIDDAENICFVL
jgi:protein-S-isoprenylcysteine O-methyltransferase Ste14